MEIINLRPSDGWSANAYAYFDLRLNKQVLIRGLTLKKNRAGQWRTIPPMLRGASVFSFDPVLAEQITHLALEQYNGGLTAHDRHAA